MKKLILCLGIICFSLLAAAQNWTAITQPTPSPAIVSLVSSDIESSVVHLTIPGYSIIPVQTQQGTAYTIKLGNATPLLVAGAPDLAKITTSLIIPEKAAMAVEVTSSSFTDYPNIDIAPSKGTLSRDIDPSTIPYSYGIQYSNNAFFPGNLASLDDPYILRDFRGQTLKVFPFQYNSVTRVLRVYYDMIVNVHKTSMPGINPLTRTKPLTSINEEFGHIYENHFLNFKGNSKYSPLGNEHGKMLIICYGPYMTYMQPFVDWKNTIGIPTEMVNMSTVGSSAANIQTYVTTYYTNHGLSFLLLVGDAAQVPTITSGFAGPSDNAYGYISGGDHYQEIFVGRFSAESPGDVQTQVTRTIDYELTPNTTPGIYNRSIAIASGLGPGDDNEMDYEHEQNLQTQMMGFTYTSKAELFDGSQGGLDAAGDPTPTMVGNEVNTGAGIITYTGHGSQTSWGTSGYSNSDIAALTNNNKLPFIWSVACVNGDFTSGTCFAEAWMRATHNGQPSGAIATLMSTINQYWNEPMERQDEMVNILTENAVANIKRSFGGLSVNGLFKMNDTYGSSGNDMTDTWTVFGDPSIMVRTANPMTMTVTHDPTAAIGQTSMLVNCNVNDAYICLSVNHQIIGTGTVSGGSANITFSPITTNDTITVAATAFNYIPYIGKVSISGYLGMNEINYNSSFNVFPNPVNNGVLNFTVTNQRSPYTIKLVSLLGKDVAVIADNINGSGGVQKLSADVSKLSNGIYFCIMKASDKTLTKKIIINK